MHHSGLLSMDASAVIGQSLMGDVLIDAKRTTRGILSHIISF